MLIQLRDICSFKFRFPEQSLLSLSFPRFCLTGSKIIMLTQVSHGTKLVDVGNIKYKQLKLPDQQSLHTRVKRQTRKPLGLCFQYSILFTRVLQRYMMHVPLDVNVISPSSLWECKSYKQHKTNKTCTRNSSKHEILI